MEINREDIFQNILNIAIEYWYKWTQIINSVFTIQKVFSNQEEPEYVSWIFVPTFYTYTSAWEHLFWYEDIVRVITSKDFIDSIEKYIRHKLDNWNNKIPLCDTLIPYYYENMNEILRHNISDAIYNEKIEDFFIELVTNNIK